MNLFRWTKVLPIKPAEKLRHRGIDILIVARRIYDLNLPHRAVAVYCYLCDRANKKGECWPSTKTIAQDLSISRRTVFHALNDLEREGLIVRKGRHRISGGRSSNLYKLEVKPDV